MVVISDFMSMNLPKYVDIKNVERYRQYKEIFPVDETEGIFVYTEKADGSQLRIGIDSSGKISAGSKNVDYNESNLPDKSFAPIVDNLSTKLNILYAEGSLFSFLKEGDNIVFYGEYLRSPKHNALKYDRVPKGNLYLFDVSINGVYKPITDICFWADALEVEPVNVLTSSMYLMKYEEVESLIKNSKSILGNVVPEGVVIKNYGISIMDTHRKISVPLMIKVVREEFKEILKQTWKRENGKGKEDILNRIAGIVNKNAVWDKAIQHVRDDGNLSYKMQDMKFLIESLDNDIEKEWKEIIKNELYSDYESDIEKVFSRGFAEYYKKKIYEQTAKELEEIR